MANKRAWVGGIPQRTPIGYLITHFPQSRNAW